MLSVGHECSNSEAVCLPPLMAFDSVLSWDFITWGWQQRKMEYTSVWPLLRPRLGARRIAPGVFLLVKAIHRPNDIQNEKSYMANELVHRK